MPSGFPSLDYRAVYGLEKCFHASIATVESPQEPCCPSRVLARRNEGYSLITLPARQIDELRGTAIVFAKMATDVCSDSERRSRRCTSSRHLTMTVGSKGRPESSIGKCSVDSKPEWSICAPVDPFVIEMYV